MSIEQQPPKPNKVDINDLPPFPQSREDVIVPPPEHRDDKDERKLGWKKPLVAVVGLGMAAGAAVFGYNQVSGGEDSNAKAPNAKPTVSAPAEPTESAPVTEPGNEPASPSESLSPTPEGPLDHAAIQSIDRAPSEEAIQYSLEPVSVAEHTPEEAVIRLMDDLKLYWLSGEPGEIGSSDLYAEGSVELGESQLDNIFGPASFRDEDLLALGWTHEVRDDITGRMALVNTEMGYEGDLTFNSSVELISPPKQLVGGETAYTVRNEWTSNMSDLDISLVQKNIDKKSYTVDRSVVLGKHAGNWHITEFSFADPSDIDEYDK